MKKIIFPLAFVLLSNATIAQKQKITFTDVEGIMAAQPYGYSQVVTTPLNGKMIIISGQTAWDSAGVIIGEGDFKGQLEYCLKNIDKILKSKGVKRDNIVKLNYYVKNLDEQKIYSITEVAQTFFTKNKYPAGCLLGVTELADPRFMVEVEATAIINN